MKLGIMQPYFMPYIGYWQLLSAVDKYVVYDDVNFIKGGWINRNRILLNGKVQNINLPMEGASSNKLINEIKVSSNSILRNKVLKTIYMAYHKTPYFEIVYPILERVLMNEETNIAKFIFYSIKEVCTYLDIETELILSSSLDKNNQLKSKDKVLEICKVLCCDEYYNAIGGKELYSVEEFEEHGVQLYFLKTKDIIYKQFNNSFESNLSIIDVLMFNSKEQIKALLGEYELLS